MTNVGWYKIQNKTETSADVLIYEQIGKSFWDDSGVSAKKFVEELRGLEVDTINLSINSPGGSVFEGNTIYNALKAHKAKVHVRVDGIAASIASVIAMAGDVIEMPENAMMMIHNPWGYVVGNSEDMRKQAEALDKIKVGLVAAYRGKTGKNDEEIADLMTAETWMTAAEAVEMGFADKMLAPVEAQANFNMLAKFRNVPAQITAGMTGKEDGEDMGDKPQAAPEITLESIKSEYPAIVEALRAEGAEAERNRIKEVHAQAMPGHEAVITAAMFDGESNAGTVAMAILAAQKQQLAAQKQAMIEDAPPAVDAGLTDQPDNLSFEDKCKSEWNKSKDLQDEFAGIFENFLAYKQESPGIRVKNSRKLEG